jgi:hypothetical protein
MSNYPTNYIEVHILCNSQNDQNEELENRIKQFQELGLSTDTLEKELQPISKEWRPGRLVLNNLEGYYPDGSGKNTIVHTVSGSCLTIRETYEQVKQLADVYASC